MDRFLLPAHRRIGTNAPRLGADLLFWSASGIAPNRDILVNPSPALLDCKTIFEHRRDSGTEMDPRIAAAELTRSERSPSILSASSICIEFQRENRFWPSVLRQFLPTGVSNGSLQIGVTPYVPCPVPRGIEQPVCARARGPRQRFQKGLGGGRPSLSAQPSRNPSWSEGFARLRWSPPTYPVQYPGGSSSRFAPAREGRDSASKKALVGDGRLCLRNLPAIHLGAKDLPGSDGTSVEPLGGRRRPDARPILKISFIIRNLCGGRSNRGKFPGPLTLACHYDGAGRISSARWGIWAPGMPRRSPKNS